MFRYIFSALSQAFSGKDVEGVPPNYATVVTPHIEMSQTEYDQLTPTEQNDIIIRITQLQYNALTPEQQQAGKYLITGEGYFEG